ncbi:MAG TPA: helix-turn-helix transcriptional regulator [Bryobacteraceae bacterium]|nr:helix-turn-helix transcriptional regulator [Bryobacteraceae bacterium]
MKEDTSILGLATIRRNRGISLEQIAQSTKISLRSLDAIERGDFRKLPGGIYNTSYIRQYARAIDYDEGAILAFYQKATAASGEVNETQAGKHGRGMFGGFRPASTVAGS